ncbi:hypothetical protein CW749_01800 [Vibrio sp. vnigr-6D03]|uniref:DUF4123 domain-containing protein n=1 Tax=Vibrio sp. vnigr-6D03 TaxID=2058088 RepID=UPI000C331F65|nr:DUF4123 domain-containing protein [Vibrio sp. vnigr-6D03]PKF81399.1 hypothetical protein CW749_01800 [Vibrio sp. vnigr-6D03]
MPTNKLSMSELSNMPEVVTMPEANNVNVRPTLLELNQSNLKHYIIASYSASTAQEIYEFSETSEIEPLYAESELQEFLSISPIVARVETKSTLFRRLAEGTPSDFDWSWILVSVPTSMLFDHLLRQLRSSLTLSFDGARRGVFHFYNPRVAHYFFGESDPSDTQTWLGEIRQVTWISPSHSPSSGSVCFFDGSAENLDVAISKVDTQKVLSPSQQIALERLHDDKIIEGYLSKQSMTHCDAQQWKRYRKLYILSENLNISQPDDIAQFFQLCDHYGTQPKNIEHLMHLKPLDSSSKFHALEQKMIEDKHYVGE